MFKIASAQREKAEEHFGRAFLTRVENLLELYINRWKLDVSAMIDYYSINCLFRASSLLYGECVLKICRPGPEVKTEIDCLQAFAGRGFCRLYDFDSDDSVLLLEAIRPGTVLRELKTAEERVYHFSKVYQGLHTASKAVDNYPSYDRWISRISRYMEGRTDQPQMRLYMLEAEARYKILRDKYSKNFLLHGDLHHDNLLLAKDGTYRIIDPKGVAGDPFFDLPRFVMNEYLLDADMDTNIRHLDHVIKLIASNLNLNPADLVCAHFIETTMGNAWMVEDGEKPDLLQVEAARLLANRYQE